ncbi:MAG: hypothetical protein WC864_09480 [Ilumatobacteraceae bacterium]
MTIITSDVTIIISQVHCRTCARISQQSDLANNHAVIEFNL